MVVNIIIIFVVKTQSNKDKYIDNNIIQFFWAVIIMTEQLHFMKILYSTISLKCITIFKLVSL